MNFALNEGDLIGGKYRVTRLLGQGGMGVVALATHEALSLEVAIKFLTEASSDSARARFAREGRAAARLKGVHTAKVFDVGVMPEGTPYLVMEYLRGTDLDGVLKSRGPLPIGELAEYMLQACEGLAEAHTAGIVHRDIKPANLFLCQEPDGRPLVKILDFGISKATFGTQDFSLTSTQAVLGSPLYMSPEQLRATHSVDHRSDIWALGVVMYELLTGRVPFNGSAITELTLKIVQDAPPNIQPLRHDVPAPLADIILRCLAKNPSDRFASAYDLAVALEPFAQQRTAASRSARVMRSVGPGAAPTGSVQPWGSTQSASVSVSSPKAPAKSTKLVWLAVPALLLLVGGAAAVIATRGRQGQVAAVKPSVDSLPSARIELPPLSATATAPSATSLPADAPTSSVALPTARTLHIRPGPPASVTARSHPPKPGPNDLPGDRN